MRDHVDLLIARSRDDVLTEEARATLETHLRTCERCRELDADLRRSEAAIRRDLTGVALPPLPSVTRPRHPFAFIALAAAVAVMVGLVAGSELGTFRSGQEARNGAGSGSGAPAAPTAPTASSARLLALVRTTDRSGPPGAAVLSGSFEKIVVLSGDGRELMSHQIQGIGVGSPSFDGRERVAYWRADAPGQPPFELTVWDLSTQHAVVLARIEGANPLWSSPVWSTDRRGIAYAAGTTSPPALAPATPRPGAEARIFTVDVAAGRTREVPASAADVSLVGVFYDGDVIGGLVGTEYRVIDAKSGRLLRKFSVHSEPLTETGAGSDGVAFGVATRFEAPSGPIVVWRAREAEDLRTIEARGVTHALFWPGRSEILFSVDGGELQTVDYISGAERRPGSGLGALVPISFEPAGTSLVARAEHGGLELLSVTSGEFAKEETLILPPEVEVIALLRGP